jgi:hypothetical protein
MLFGWKVMSLVVQIMKFMDNMEILMFKDQNGKKCENTLRMFVV